MPLTQINGQEQKANEVGLLRLKVRLARYAISFSKLE